MNKNTDLRAIKTKFAAYWPRLGRHFSFITIIFILLVYLLTVWRISQLSSAEPSVIDQNPIEITSVPKVDQKAINQVLLLENSSPQVHSLFNAARNNPFGE